VVALTPLVSMTSSIYASSDLFSSRPAAEQWLPPAVGAAIWSALAIAASTVISHIIYGLRREVRKAMQLGQYVLEEKIGEGGMGAVYRASHAMLRRPTAIKLLSGTASHATERFEREVQITARLTHPNTIAVFDYGRTPDGVFYYAMEYLEGITLEDLVVEDGPQPARRVAHVLLQMCGALSEAHDAGLVHRDIKPANVMLTRRGGMADFVKVLDFGLVKESAHAGAASNLATSMVNTILGTPHYMAPEAILEPTSTDARADLYAVGATAYFLLTGEHVFGGANLVEICSQHLHEAPVPPSKKRADIPLALEEVVLACLRKKPADRPANAAKLASLIQACALGEWSPLEAQDWWAAREAKTAPVATAAGEVSAFGKTIAVALEGRELS
jgi:serine/threonine-protein kinase